VPKTFSSRIALAAVFALLLCVYAYGAKYHADHVNTQMGKGDQLGYLHTTQKMVDKDPHYMGDRNRMPLYSWMQILVFRPGMADAAFFPRAKLLNIALSIFLLMLIYLLLRHVLSFGGTLNLTCVIAFGVYMFRSPYVQCEVLFYSLMFAAFYGMLFLFLKPRLSTAMLTGGAIGMGYLTKAAVVPGLILFTGFFAFDAIQKNNRSIAPSDAHKNNAFYRIRALALVLSLFLVIVFPYIQQNKQIFGKYFYNVNTNFYVWTDSWEEAKRLTRSHNDRVGWPTMPADQIPSFQKYLREHTLSEMIQRVVSGTKRIKSEIAVSYGYQYFMVLYILGALLALTFKFSKLRTWVLQHSVLSVFTLAYFSASLFLCAWAVPMNGGPRFILAYFMPFMFVLLMGIEYAYKNQYITLGSLRISWMRLFHASTLILFLFKGPYITTKIMSFYSGN